MENNRIKPDILSNESLLRRNLEATAPPFFEELQPDVQKGIRGKNRGREIRRDTDKIQDTSINLQDIDETIKYYLEERLNLSVLMVTCSPWVSNGFLNIETISPSVRISVCFSPLLR